MAIRYKSTLRTARLNLVKDELPNGYLVIGTSSLSGSTGILAKIPLTSTGATVSGDVLTLHGLPLEVIATGTGTAAKAELRDSADAVVADGLTVNTSAADVVIASTSIASGQTVRCTAATITHPS
jgi:hypothetical protein